MRFRLSLAAVVAAVSALLFSATGLAADPSPHPIGDEDLNASLHRLSTAAATRCAAPLDALVDGLLADLVGSSGAADDIAIVAVRRLSRG